jgi:hypothetical protein
MRQVETRVKAWTQPASDRQITGVIADLFRSRQELIAESEFLRQRLAGTGMS